MDIWFALNRFCRSAARRPTRCLLAACFAGGVADSSVASPIDFDLSGTSHFAVLSIPSRTSGLEAGKNASKNTLLMQAKSNALRVAATTLSEGSGKSSSARTATVSGAAGVNAPVLKQGMTTMLTLGGQSTNESIVLEVLRGWTLNSTNIDVTAGAASSDVLFNILGSAAVTWDEIVSNASRAPPMKIPPGLLKAPPLQ